jgi:Uma2 family endonuclease
MAVARPMSEQAYQEFVLSGAEGAWELHDGRLVAKPGVTWEHGGIIALLSHLFQLQLDRSEYQVRINEGCVRKPSDTVFIPDLLVVPSGYGEPFRGRPGKLAIFSGPLPLVVEVWSSSTGGYDVDTKVSVYQQRGDLEIWRIHPYERTLIAWQRQPDGSYQETMHRGGTITPVALPGVAIDLEALFDD